MHHVSRKTLVLAVALWFAAGGAYAHNAASSAAAAAQHSAAASSVPKDDRTFAMKAAAAGMAEVAEGKVAQEKADSDQVKQFGQRMVTDHSKANDELKQIASKKGIDLPGKLDKSAEGEIDKLQKLSGAEFDAAYMKKQVSAHHKAISEFEKEAKSGKDADLKRFAADTVPTLREHLRLAEAAQTTAEHESQAGNGSPSGNRAQGQSSSGLAAAKKATGASYAASEKSEGMPVPKTGM